MMGFLQNESWIFFPQTRPELLKPTLVLGGLKGDFESMPARKNNTTNKCF
jgi:hypothetical protein